MAESTLSSLKAHGVRSVLVANRTVETARLLADALDGRVVEPGGLDAAVTAADIILCSTSADRFLLDRRQVESVMKVRRQRPLFLIDISVPRNLDPEIGRIENVYLYDMDDLQEIASANVRMRQGEIRACDEIVERELQGVMNRFSLSRTEAAA